MKKKRFYCVLSILIFTASCSKSALNSFLKPDTISTEVQIVLIDAMKQRDWETVYKVINSYPSALNTHNDIGKIRDAFLSYDICKDEISKGYTDNIFSCLNSQASSFNAIPRQTHLGEQTDVFINTFRSDVWKEIKSSRIEAVKKRRLKIAEIKKQEKQNLERNAERQQTGIKNKKNERSDIQKKERTRIKNIFSENKPRRRRQKAEIVRLEKFNTNKVSKTKLKSVKKVETGDIKESDFYTKKSMASFLTIILAVSLNEESILYSNISIKVLNKEAPISDLIVEVSPKDLDVSITKTENLRIISLACQIVGEVTMKSNWESRYLNVAITRALSLERLNVLFLTKECRKFHKLQKKEKGKATLYWIQLFIDALVRAKENTNLIANLK